MQLFATGPIAKLIILEFMGGPSAMPDISVSFAAAMITIGILTVSRFDAYP